MSSPVLALSEVVVRYGGRAALEVPTFAVEPGEALAVIGPNSAGTSTLLRVLSLLERPERGTGLVHGGAVTSKADRLG